MVVVVVMAVTVTMAVSVVMRVSMSFTASLIVALMGLARGRWRRRVTAAAAAGSRLGLERGGTVIVFLMCHGGGLDSL
ncbi:hypothetical protein [Mitsuaria sp. TWR114]|uniref:hypothetical protein n=1 Tax=Mitsuaria sp. TWR114 TaxID=2601731 RepID=UPI001C9A5ABD|nr:hypothetical protein [Mitsuaria sp. TWR114]